MTLLDVGQFISCIQAEEGESRYRDHAFWGGNIQFENIADSYAFSAEGKTAWNESVIEGVNLLLWQIIFSDELNKQKLYVYLESILDNELDWDSSVGPLLTARK